MSRWERSTSPSTATTSTSRRRGPRCTRSARSLAPLDFPLGPTFVLVDDGSTAAARSGPRSTPSFVRARCARPARVARDRASRAADPPRLRSQEPPDLARRARPCVQLSRDRRGRPLLLVPAAERPRDEIRVVPDYLRAPAPEPPRRHLLSSVTSSATRRRLLGGRRAPSSSRSARVKKLPTLRGRHGVNLFFDSSTRTSSSFELAAKRLSADVMS